MSISHELSGEIAAALFAAKERSPGELNDLKDMLFQIHSTLEQLTQSDRQVPHPQSESKTPSETNTNTASAASG